MTAEQSSDADPAVLGALAATVAREAGALLLRGLPGTREVATKSTDTDPVTEMDRAAEALIVRRILEARPHDAVLGEEGGGRDGTSGVRWVIDPLDGTVNYLYRIPAFAVAIGVEVDGVTVAGAVYDPSRDELFTAAAGRGAHLNGAAIRPSIEHRLTHALTGTGFGYDTAVRAQQATVLARVLPRIRDLRRAGSAALDLCAVACGRLDAYFERGVQLWDVCAASLIVREAGGRSETLDGGPIGPDRTWIAANASLFPAFRALLAEATGPAAGAEPAP